MQLKVYPENSPCVHRALAENFFRFMPHVKLHIPGPVEVSEKTFQAFRSPMIGHRGQGFKDLYAKIQPQLQSLLYTKQLVYLSTSSAWGVIGRGRFANVACRKRRRDKLCVMRSSGFAKTVT